MIKLTFATLVLVIGVCSAHGQQYFYTAKGIVSPAHNAKDQLYVLAGWGGGVDVNLSYSAARNFNVFFTGTKNEGKRRRFNFLRASYIVKDNNAYTGGVGYFTPLGGRGFNHFEASAGYGVFKGDNEIFYPQPEDSVRGTDIVTSRYNSFFIAASLLEKRKGLMVGFSGRLAYSIFSELTHDYKWPYGPRKRIFTGLRPLTAEPVFLLGGYHKGFTYQLQIGFAVALNRPSADRTEEGQPFLSPVIRHPDVYAAIGRIGVSYTLDRGKK